MTDQPNKDDDIDEGLGQGLRKEEKEPTEEQAVEIPEDDRRAYVNKYTKAAEFPFETGETVWIVKPGFRAPLGEFVITKAHPNNVFELKNKNDGTAHSELVEGKHLRRDPYTQIS